jgi:hypothetical protein
VPCININIVKCNFGLRKKGKQQTNLEIRGKKKSCHTRPELHFHVISLSRKAETQRPVYGTHILFSIHIQHIKHNFTIRSSLTTRRQFVATDFNYLCSTCKIIPSSPPKKK